MERVTAYLYENENPEARRREDEVRQGKHAFVVAAEKTVDLTGIRLSEAQQQKLSMAYHWGYVWDRWPQFFRGSAGWEWPGESKPPAISTRSPALDRFVFMQFPTGCLCGDPPRLLF